MMNKAHRLDDSVCELIAFPAAARSDLSPAPILRGSVFSSTTARRAKLVLTLYRLLANFYKKFFMPSRTCRTGCSCSLDMEN